MQLTVKEFAELPSGTKAIKIKTFDGNTGKQVDVVYIPIENNDDFDSDLEDAEEVDAGYFTERWNTTKK